MARPKNWETLSDEAREAWRVKEREKRRKSYEANPEKTLERNRKSYKMNREKALERMRRHHKLNRDKRLECARKYKKVNPEKVAKWNRKYRTKLRTQADADRFFQMMGAAEELTKIIKQRKDEQTEKMGNDE